MALTRVKGKVLQTSVDTINDLPTTGYEGQVIEVLGYWTKGDGGGGTFRCSTTTGVGANHNGGTIFDPDVAAGTYTGGAGDIAWYRQYDGAVNVKWFGAKGDGVSDSFSSFNSATQLEEEIYAPEGTYILSGRVVFNASFRGAGSDKTTLKGTQLTTPNYLSLIQCSGNAIYSGFTVDSSVSDDPVSWDSTNYDSFVGWRGVEAIGDDIIFEDILSKNCEYGAFRAVFRNRIKYTNCRTNKSRGNYGDGFYSERCKDVLYENCKAEDYTRIGFVADGANSVAGEVVERINYINCVAENGHDASIDIPGAINADYNSGFWCELFDSVSYSSCYANNNTHRGFTAASATGNIRRVIFKDCLVVGALYGYVTEGLTTDDKSKLNATFIGCDYRYVGDFNNDVYAIGAYSEATLINCSAKINSLDLVSSDQIRAISAGNKASVYIDGFTETWDNRPSYELYDVNKGKCSIGGYTGSGAVPHNIHINNYKNSAGLPGTVKWIGQDITGTLIIRNSTIDIPKFNCGNMVLIDNCNIGTDPGNNAEQAIAGSFNKITVSNSNIHNRFTINWGNDLDIATFSSCKFTRLYSIPSVYSYNNSSNSYKPSRINIIDSTFISDFENQNYCIHTNGDPSVVNEDGQNVFVSNCIFYNTGGVTSNYIIKMETTSGTASVGYINGAWKSSSLTNVATYLKGGSTINDL